MKEDSKVIIPKFNLDENYMEVYPELEGEGDHTFFPDCHNLVDNFEKAAQKYSENTMVQFREVKSEEVSINRVTREKQITTEYGPVQSLKYREMRDIMINFSKGLLKVTNNAEEGENVGIYMNTSKEFQIGMYGAWRNNFTIVTCYRTLGFDVLRGIIQDTNMGTIICDVKALNWLSILKNDCPKLRNIIYVGKPEKYQIFDPHYNIVSFQEVLNMGKELSDQPEERKCSEKFIPLIQYTSGTTSKCKGVCLPHKSLLSLAKSLTKRCFVHDWSSYLGYLPLSHIMEQSFEICFFSNGGCVKYGNKFTLLAKPGGAKTLGDFAAYRCTHFCAVPRVYSIMKKNILLKINAKGAIARSLFKLGYSIREKLYQKHNYKAPTKFQWKLWDKILFKKFKNLIGGNCLLAMSGGAPLHKELQDFVTIMFGLRMGQGYGMTELGGACITGDVFKPDVSGKNGWSYNQRIRLYDVPEMDYSVKSEIPKGEIAIHKEFAFTEYYKNDVETKKIVQNGWVFSGDIGQYDPKDGSITVIDRKKALVKFGHGEYISLLQLETIYGNTPFVQANGICIVADFKKDCLCAIVIPEKQYCQKWVQKHDSKKKVYVESEKLKQQIMSEFAKIGKEKKVKKFEYIVDLVLSDVIWGVENGFMTTSMKMKRNVIKKHYEKEIQEMFQKIEN